MDFFLFLMVKIGIQLPQVYDWGGLGFSHCGHPDPCDDLIFEMNFGKKDYKKINHWNENWNLIITSW
jgi:hypothetical protein